MFYKNTSYSAKTFHGVTFRPGETKEVNDYINNKFMILVDKVESTANTQQRPSSVKLKKDAPKEEKPQAEVVIVDTAEEHKS